MVIHPVSKWTLYKDKLNLTIHANNIFEIASCAVYIGEAEKVNFPCTQCNSEDEYLEAMEKQGFTITIN